jgi:hypothetical protein
MLEQSEYVRKILISFVLYRSSGESFATKSSIANYVHHVNVMAGGLVSYLHKPVWGIAGRKKDVFMPLFEAWLFMLTIWVSLAALKRSWTAKEIRGIQVLGMAFIFRAKTLLP